MDFYLISNMYPTQEYPGYGSFVKNVCDELSKLGIKKKYSSVIRGRSRTKLDKLWKYVKFYSSIVINYCKSYDFIYIHFPNHAAPILYPLLSLKRKNLIINLHGEDLLYSKMGYGSRLGKVMEKMARKYASAIVVPSEYFKEIVIQRKIVDSNRIIISPSGGINHEIFFPKPFTETDQTRLHIGYVGRMEKDKGIIEFLYTCYQLNKLGIKYKATAIGYGSSYEWAKGFILDNNLTAVELISGLSQNQLGEYYRQFDLLIFMSSRRSESLGLTGIEALACGTPVIGSKIGGIATYIQSDYNGWLVNVGDVNGVVEKILNFRALSTIEKKYIYQNAIITGQKYYSSKVCQKLCSDLWSIVGDKICE
ncbi:MAG: glycosyltransferase family 4 protein [Bacteroides sp.]|nr:glycosyltransferase family 4 protein [Bacteroides sp.]